MPARICLACGGVNATQRCSKCKSARYCNEDCQLAHWHLHRHICQLLGGQQPPRPVLRMGDQSASVCRMYSLLSHVQLPFAYNGVTVQPHSQEHEEILIGTTRGGFKEGWMPLLREGVHLDFENKDRSREYVSMQADLTHPDQRGLFLNFHMKIMSDAGWWWNVCNGRLFATDATPAATTAGSPTPELSVEFDIDTVPVTHLYPVLTRISSFSFADGALLAMLRCATEGEFRPTWLPYVIRPTTSSLHIRLEELDELRHFSQMTTMLHDANDEMRNFLLFHMGELHRAGAAWAYSESPRPGPRGPSRVNLIASTPGFPSQAEVDQRRKTMDAVASILRGVPPRTHQHRVQALAPIIHRLRHSAEELRAQGHTQKASNMSLDADGIENELDKQAAALNGGDGEEEEEEEDSSDDDATPPPGHEESSSDDGEDDGANSPPSQNA